MQFNAEDFKTLLNDLREYTIHEGPTLSGIGKTFLEVSRIPVFTSSLFHVHRLIGCEKSIDLLVIAHATWGFRPLHIAQGSPGSGESVQVA